MIGIGELFNKDTDRFLSMLKEEIEIICLHNGVKFQVVYNKDKEKVTFHLGDNFNTKIGKEITDMDKLFTDGLQKSIKKLEEKKSILAEYNYMLFEAYNGKLYLISVIDKNLKINKDMYKVAKVLDVNLPEYTYKGKLTNEQRNLIIGLIQENTLVGKDEFNEFIRTIFNIDEKKFNPNFYQILFNMKYDKKMIQTIFNCVCEENDDINKSQNKDIVLKLKDEFKECKSDADFISLMNNYKTYNKLYNIGIKLKDNEYSICTEALSPEIQSLIKSKGKVVKRLYENFVILNYINNNIKNK